MHLSRILFRRAAATELVGLTEAPDGDVVTLKLKGGDEVEIPRKEIGNAHLVYRWK